MKVAASLVVEPSISMPAGGAGAGMARLSILGAGAIGAGAVVGAAVSVAVWAGDLANVAGRAISEPPIAPIAGAGVAFASSVAMTEPAKSVGAKGAGAGTFVDDADVTADDKSVTYCAGVEEAEDKSVRYAAGVAGVAVLPDEGTAVDVYGAGLAARVISGVAGT